MSREIMEPFRGSSANIVEDSPKSFSLYRDIFQRYNDEHSVFSRHQFEKAQKAVGANQKTQPSNLTSENEQLSTIHCPAASVLHTPPAPPPPPPPLVNGNYIIPSIRLKSEIPDYREPPAKLQTAMAKDKKPFSYAPGGIDFSEIKSPRIQRRIIRNAQTPEDVVLPSNTNTNPSLPPLAVAAMMPQMAIPVFPQNNAALKTQHQTTAVRAPPAPSPPKTAAQKQVPTQYLVRMASTPHVENVSAVRAIADSHRTPRAGSIYVPPVVSGAPVFPNLKEAPTPWLQKHQQPQGSMPPWANRGVHQRQQDTLVKNMNSHPAEIRPSTNGVANKGSAEINAKPIQGRSFKVLQKMTGSEDDTTDFNSNALYNSDETPLTVSQLRRLHLDLHNGDDKAFTNRGVKAQVDRGVKAHVTDGGVTVINIGNGHPVMDEDSFLLMETDPRYCGSAIPSKAFRMLQNITDAGSRQVVTTNTGAASNHNNNYNHHNIVTVNSKEPQSTIVTGSKPMTVTQNRVIAAENYIPPSERQAEQDLRKYMGSSIPSRSFRMLQAMTATED